MKWSELKEGRYYKHNADIFYITKVDVYTDNCRVEFIDYNNGRKGHWAASNEEEVLIEPFRIDFANLSTDTTILISTQGDEYLLQDRYLKTYCEYLLLLKNLRNNEWITVSEEDAQKTLILKTMLDHIKQLKQGYMNKKLIEDASGKYLIDIAQAIRMGCAIEKTFPTSWGEYLDAIKGTKYNYNNSKI